MASTSTRRGLDLAAQIGQQLTERLVLAGQQADVGCPPARGGEVAGDGRAAHRRGPDPRPRTVVVIAGYNFKGTWGVSRLRFEVFTLGTLAVIIAFAVIGYWLGRPAREQEAEVALAPAHAQRSRSGPELAG